MIKGDKILGKGVHGCAIYGKPLKCENGYKINDKKLIKLAIKKDDFLDEINNTLLINFIDKNDTSIKIEEACIVDISKLTDEDDIKKISACKLKFTPDKEDKGSSKRDRDLIIDNKLYQIIYNKKDIGIDLNKLILTNKISIEKILAMSLRLYESLYLYSKYEISFMDIKPDNIIYLKNKDKLKFIDYGLISNFKNLLFKTEFLKYDYPYYSPELKLIYCINNNKSFEYFLAIFLENFKFKDVIILSDTLFKIYPTFEKDLEDMYNYYMSIKKKNPSYDAGYFFSDEHKSKIALYSLSILLLEILCKYDNQKFKIKDMAFVKNFIKDIILPSISFNIDDRITIKDTIYRFKLLKSKNSEINKIIKDEKLLDNISLVKNIHKSKSLESPLLYEKKLLKNIDNCNKTKPYYLLMAKKYNIKNRHKMNKKDLCNTLKNIKV